MSWCGISSVFQHNLGCNQELLYHPGSFQTMSKILCLPFLSFTIVLWLMGLNPALGQQRTTTTQLRQWGADPATLRPITWSHNEKWLAAYDRAPFEEKKEGVFFRIWLFEIGPAGSIINTRKVPIGLTSLQQAAFSPTDDALIVMGNRGTTWYRLDMKSFKLEDLMVAQANTPGFRADPEVIWSNHGKLYTVGYPYDQNRFINARTVATINTNRTGSEAFTPGPDLTTLQKGIEHLWMVDYMSPTSIFYGQRFPDKVILSHWDGTGLTEFDRTPRFWGTWASADRLLYAAKRSDKSSDLVVFDAPSKTKTTIASNPTPFRYLFLSGDGDTLVASLDADRGRLISFYARSADGWKLRPVNPSGERNQSIAPGFMRVSVHGKYLAQTSATGLSIYLLP